MPTRNVNLTVHFDHFVESQIEAGSYHNASEVMRAGLRLLEQHTQEEREKLALLRSLAAEAFEQIDQGQGIEIGGERQLAGFIKGVGRTVATSARLRKNGT